MKSESAVQADVRLATAREGREWLLRNNVGVLKDRNGRPVRYGLANDSAAMNEKCKSADLIGIETYVIKPEDVGKTVGIFRSIELKEEGFHPSKCHGDDWTRYQAQVTWMNKVNSMGGHAQIVSDAKQLVRYKP